MKTVHAVIPEIVFLLMALPALSFGSYVDVEVVADRGNTFTLISLRESASRCTLTLRKYLE
jgi:hypothetical protein